jgi:hypothetical protein
VKPNKITDTTAEEMRSFAMPSPSLSRILPIVVAGLLLPAVDAIAQALPTKTISKPVAEFEEPFTQINSVRELSDGRVIVNDPRDRLVHLLDLESGEAVQIGREGQGPGEYSFPMGVFAVPGDTTLLFDPLSQRLLVISPNGKTSREISLRREGSGPGMGRLAPPKGTDARGRLYSEGMGFQMGPGGPQVTDSVPVMRFDLARGGSDTLAFIPVPKSNTQVSGGSGNVQVRVGMPNPLAPRVEWDVAPDGRVAVVTPDPYRVTWIAPNGARTVGPVINVPKEKVTEADKKAIEEARKGQTAMMITRSDGPGRAPQQQARAMSASDLPPLTDWPEYKPPFTANAARVAPNGDLWVRRTRPPGDEVPFYDVFDARGRLTGHVRLPKGARLVGFGKGSVYVVRTDADDLQYLQKYAL